MSGPHVHRPPDWGPLFPRKDAAPLAGRAGVNNRKLTPNSMQSITPPAHSSAPFGTSDVAAQRIASKAGTIRDRVYAMIVGASVRGLTDDEGQQLAGVRMQTWTPRRGELVKLGLVVDSGERRPTSSGRPAAVWVASTLARNAPRTAPKASGVSDAPRGGRA